jgi:hypothetical protein
MGSHCNGIAEFEVQIPVAPLEMVGKYTEETHGRFYYVLERLENMTQEERLHSLVQAGILNDNLDLADDYCTQPQLREKRARKKMKERPSVYLEEKCEGLEKVIDFFLSSKGGLLKPADEKLLVFLHQIDFWDWEIENLIFSFDNFEERSRAWETTGGIAAYLNNRFGILVKNKTADRVELDRRYREVRRRYKEWWNPDAAKKNEVYAPWEKLVKVVDKWNQLITLCEERVLVAEKHRKTAADLGAQVLPNLDKFRKQAKRSESD